MCRHGRLLRVARPSCRSRAPCSTGPGSTLGQPRYLPSCVNKALPTSANFESNLLLVTNVTRCTGSNAKTLGLKHLRFTDMRVSGGFRDEARVVRHWTDELLVEQDFFPDGNTISPL